MKENRELIINSIAFGIGNFLSKFISLILITLYTNVFTVGEFGLLDMFITTATLFSPILTLSIYEGVLRFSLVTKYSKKKILSTSYAIVVITNIILLPIVLFISKFLFSFEYVGLFYLYLVTTIMYQMISYSVKGMDKIKIFTVAGILLSICILIYNIIFLNIIDAGVNGYLIANSLANVTVIFYLIYKSKVYNYISKKEISKDYGRMMLRYSVYLIPNAIFWWIINSSDRYMLKWYCDYNELGLFSAAYKFPSMMFMISTIFIQAWNISSMKTEDDSLKDYVSDIYNKYFFVVIIVCSFLIVVLKLLTKIFMADIYYVSWIYSPPLILSFTFNALSTFVGSIYLVKKENLGNMITTLIGCIVNIVLNIILIHYWKGFGAGIATFISQLVIYIIRTIDTQKYLKIKYYNLHSIISICILLMQCMILYLNSYFGFFINLVLLLLLIVINKKYLTSIYFIIKYKFKKG